MGHKWAGQDRAVLGQAIGEVRALAERLERIAVERAAPQPVERAKAAIFARRRRDAFFNPSLFADPAWDILLDLFVAAEEGRTVSVSSLCIGAAVPVTTGLRWIKGLENEGVLERTPDPGDGRRFFLRLNANIQQAMVAYWRDLDPI